jgi:hypothetical protein
MNAQIFKRPKTLLMLGAVALAICGAALGRPRTTSGSSASSSPPATVAPYALARILSTSPPEVVVVTLGEGRHPLLGSIPITLFGETEEQQIAAAPRVRRIVLVGADEVQADRFARRMAEAGRDVSVLAGGREAWDRAMDSDPAAPPKSAGAADRARYLENVALRRYFGDKSAAPKAVSIAPVAAPVLAPAARPKKREGC